MSTTQYPNLRHLLGSYLHQDYADEFPSADEAVRVFARREPPETVTATAAEISTLLSDTRFHTDASAQLTELDCYYDPTADGLSPDVWLKAVRDILLQE